MANIFVSALIRGFFWFGWMVLSDLAEFFFAISRNFGSEVGPAFEFRIRTPNPFRNLDSKVGPKVGPKIWSVCFFYRHATVGELSVLSFLIDFRSRFLDQVFGPRFHFLDSVLGPIPDPKNPIWVDSKYILGRAKICFWVGTWTRNLSRKSNPILRSRRECGTHLKACLS